MDTKSYGGGIARCDCGRLPHIESCPAAPFFSEDQRLKIDEGEQPSSPFGIKCPKCSGSFSQTEHVLSYQYGFTSMVTEKSDLPIQCPLCGYSDYGLTPQVGDEEEYGHFVITCPQCDWTGDRTDGIIDVWLEKAVVQGTEILIYYGHEYKKGEIYAEYTDLSITCPECGYGYGEEDD